MTEALKAIDVHYDYGGATGGAAVCEAIRGISVDIARGEFVSLIGPNGSGKTTLLRLLSGSLSPDRGTVEIFGRDARAMRRREAARKVAVVPQETSVAFAFTVEEIVLMGRFPHLGAYGFEGEHDLELAREAMKLTETLKFAGRSIQDLSGGERQRVIIARALAQEADVLLLDEPTAFLDIRHQVEVSRLVGNLKKEKGLTVVAASHDLNLAASFCDRLVLLKEGEVFAEGPPEEVIDESILGEAYETEVFVGNWEEGPFVVPRTRL